MTRELIPQFVISALCDDEATGEFFFKIVFRSVDGSITTIDVPRAELDNKKSLLDTLKNAGAFFHEEQELNNAAIQQLVHGQLTAQRITYARATGWRGSGKLFVTPGEVINRGGDLGRIRPPQFHALHLKCGRAGTLAGWKKHVADPAQYSSRLVFSICLGLAAPLLRLTELHSFGIMVGGPSKSGKSTMQVAGGSVIGLSKEDDLPSFDITVAGFSELLARSSDLLVPMNEAGLLPGSHAERNVRFRRTAYVIAQGSGTQYSTHANMPAHGEVNERRCIVLASGEESLDELAQKAGETREPGSMIRLIDLPAVTPGATDIFDFAPDMPDDDRLRWVQETCLKIRSGAEEHHGVALSVLVKKVIRERVKVVKRLARFRNRFVDQYVEDRDDQIIRHMALLFGHVYAAGIIGVRFNILPWSEEFVMKAIKRCWYGARRSMRLESELRRAAIKALRQAATSSNVVQGSLRKPDLKRYRNADGYYRRQNGERQLVVRGERFKSWFSDSRQPGLVLRWLCDRGGLANAKGRQHTGSSIVWAESQVEWPDGTRPRSIVILADKLK